MGKHADKYSCPHGSCIVAGDNEQDQCVKCAVCSISAGGECYKERRSGGGEQAVWGGGYAISDPVTREGLELVC